MNTTLSAAEELNPLVPHTAEIFLGLVVFAIVFFAIRKFVVPNFEKAYAARTAAIEGGMEEANKAQAERVQVLQQLRTEVGSVATTLASRIVGESLDDEVRQKRTVERFIAELEE